MSVFYPGDKVRIALKQPYTEEEIRHYGCHPDVDGKTGTIVGRDGFVDNDISYEIKLDEKMQPHKLHSNTVFEAPFDIYLETSKHLEIVTQKENCN